MPSAAVQFDGLDTASLPERPLHLAIGMFDGVHMGHQAVIESAVHSARRTGGMAGVLTFWPHPRALFSPLEMPRMILSPHMKLRVLGSLGVDFVIQQEFTADFAALPAEEFVPFLKRHLPKLAGIYVGQNWRFGAGRKGDSEMLLVEARRCGISMMSVSPIKEDGAAISSTRIRQCIEEGRIDEANNLLGYTYFSEGKVTSGRRLARTLGFPTLNLPWTPDLRPRFGVYAVRVVCPETGNLLPAVANYGVRPTVENAGAQPQLEVHVLGECPFACGDELMVEWMSFIRPEARFEGIEALRAQVENDIAGVRAWFAKR